MPRRQIDHAAVKQEIIRARRSGWPLRDACERAGVHVSTACRWRNADPDFALKLLKAGLPCGPVLNSEQALNHPHAKARGALIEKDWYKGIGTPVKLSRTPGSLKAPPPKFSQHTREVLGQHGFDEAAIEKLMNAGVLVEKRRA